MASRHEFLFNAVSIHRNNSGKAGEDSCFAAGHADKTWHTEWKQAYYNSRRPQLMKWQQSSHGMNLRFASRSAYLVTRREDVRMPPTRVCTLCEMG